MFETTSVRVQSIEDPVRAIVTILELLDISESQELQVSGEDHSMYLIIVSTGEIKLF